MIQWRQDSIPQNGAGEINIHMPRNEAQFSSVSQSCPTLCDPVDFSTADLPIHHQLKDFTQTHVHWVGDAIQPSHPLLIPSLPNFNLSQHQGRFEWVSFSHEVAKVLEFQLWHQSFHQIFRTDCLEMDSLDLPSVQGLSKVFFNTTVQKHQFSSAQI